MSDNYIPKKIKLEEPKVLCGWLSAGELVKVMGVKGSNIQRIQKESGATSIKIQRLHRDSFEFLVTGSTLAILKAMYMIRDHMIMDY